MTNLKRKFEELEYGEDKWCNPPRNRIGAVENCPTPEYQNIEAVQVAQLNLRVASLEREVQDLKNEQQSSSPRHEERSQQAAIFDPKIISVVKVTQELFSGSTIEIETESDPMEPENEFVVVKVSCKGELQEILKKEMEWNRKLDKSEPGYSGRIRLLVVPFK